MTRRKKPNARIRKLIEEATVDAYDETEQEIGFLTMLEDSLAFPLEALVVGEEVKVTGVEPVPGGRGIEAVCERKGRTYRVGVTSLEWPGKPPEGSEWIHAYEAWLRGNW